MHRFPIRNFTSDEFFSVYGEEEEYYEDEELYLEKEEIEKEAMDNTLQVEEEETKKLDLKPISCTVVEEEKICSICFDSEDLISMLLLFNLFNFKTIST